MRWLAFLALLLTTSPASASVRFALVVGNDLGAANEVPLAWAEQDARRVRLALTELGGVAPERAILALGESVTEVRMHLARLRGQVEEARRQGFRTELFLFFSGHGDAEALHLGAGRLPLDELQRTVKATPADTAVVILDACRSRSVGTRPKGARARPAFDIQLARPSGPRGLVLIRSAAADEVAQESDELSGSFFTHHLLSGLRGAADRDGDGRVTLSEVYMHAYRRTLVASHGQTAAVQHPEMAIELAGEGELVMTVLARATATLRLHEELTGDVLVVDDRNGHVVTELNKTAGASRPLALPAGRYRVQVRREGRVLAGEVPLEWGGHRTLRNEMLSEQPLVAAVRKGAQLDPHPWQLNLSSSVATAAVLDRVPAWGVRLGAERALRGETWFVAMALGWSQARDRNEVWQWRHDELDATLSSGVTGHLGPLRLLGSVGAGLVAVVEAGSRRDRERLVGVDDAVLQTAGARLGPRIATELGLQLPLGDSWALRATTEVSVAWVPVGPHYRSALQARALIGVGRAF